MIEQCAASLSRRIGPAFTAAALAGRLVPDGFPTACQTMEQHKAEYRRRPLSERLHGTFMDVACPAKAYKPAHGGYPE